MFSIFGRRIFAQLIGQFHLRNFVQSLVLGVLAAVVLQREQDRGSFSALDAPLMDYLRQQRVDKPSPQGPVIFISCKEADAAETDRQFMRWPLSTGDWASVFPEMAGYKPKTLAVFPKLPIIPPDDALKATLGQVAGRLIATPAEAFAPNVEWTLPDNFPTISLVSGPVGGLPEIKTLPELTEALDLGPAFPMELELGDGAAGKVKIEDGMFKAPLVFRCQGKVVPSLLLASLAQFLEIPVTEAAVVLGRFITIGQFRFPVDLQGNASLPWTAENQIPMASVPLDTFKLTATQLDKFLSATNPIRETIKSLGGSFCLVGYDESAAKRHKLADGTAFSAAGITASLAAAYLQGDYLLETAPAVKWSFLACCLVLALLVYLMRFPLAILGTASAICGLLVFPFLVYQHDVAYLSPVPGLLLLLLLPWALRLLNAPHRSKPATVVAAFVLLAIGYPTPSHAHHQPGVTIEMLTEQISKTPNMPELYFQRGSELLYQRRFEESSADFRKALELDIQFLPARRLLAQILAEQGKSEEALAEINEGIRAALAKQSEPQKLDYWLPQCYCQQAALLLNLNKPQEALTALDAALKNNRFPDLDLYRLRGETLRMLGKNEQRIAELKASHEATGAILLRNEWLEALIDSDRYAEAIPIVETELKNMRFRASWLIRRARLHLLEKQPDPAKTMLGEAVKELNERLAMEMPPYLLLLDRGLAHCLLGDKLKAKEDLQRAKDLGARPGEWRMLERALAQ